MWGKGFASHRCYDVARITPTCVGKSKIFVKKSDPSGDHPHVCWEKREVADGERYASGSPPRVWGKENPVSQIGDLWRITPTCVGKSAFCSGGTKVIRGSPPRVWGKVQVFRGGLPPYGITPTCVGKRGQI